MNPKKETTLRFNFIIFRAKSTMKFTAQQIAEAINGKVEGYADQEVTFLSKIEEGKPHNLKSDLWCPPAKCVDKIGRLNDVGESVFYSAFSLGGVF